MDDATLLASWQQILMALALVVVAAATLLISIWWAAQRILKGAVQALQQVQRIQGNTRQIWSLKTTNQVAGEILETAVEIEKNGATIAQTLCSAEDKSGAA